MVTRRFAVVSAAESLPSQGPCLRVAVATQDSRMMNAHFGSARRFVVYEVSATERRRLQTVDFSEVSSESGEHTARSDDRNGEKIAALADVDVLVVQAIGGPVAARVIRARIHPIKVPQAQPIEQVIDQVQQLLQSPPPPWLRRLFQQRGTRSMDFLDDSDDEQ